MASTKTKTKNKNTDASSPYTTQSPAAAYKHFLPACQKLAEDAVRPCTADIDVARHNIERGVTAIRPHLTLIKKKLPLCPITEVLELPSVALALTFAADRITIPASRGQIADRLAALRPMRDLTLRQLEILAELGLAPPERVRAIRAGTGPIDSARDAVAIAALFEEINAAVAGKHPFSSVYLKELSAHGEWLLQQLKPDDVADTPAAADPAAGIRDRMWTLLVTRHEHLREAGVAAFGLKALDERVPPIGSRLITRAPAPAITPTPPAP